MCLMWTVACSPLVSLPLQRLIIRAGTSLVATAFFLCINAAPCLAAPQTDGGALYRKHCAHCHPDAAKLKMPGKLVDDIRMPPPGMPAFGEEKLSDTEVRSIGEYILPAGKRVSLPEVAPAAPAAAVEPTPAAPSQTSMSTATVQAPAASKPGKAKRTWNGSFARTWTIKGRQDGEVVDYHRLTIAANGNDEPAVDLISRLTDYTVKVTAFHLADRTLKLELTWGWTLNPGYWKLETFDLRLSDDGRKLSGTRAIRTSGGQSATVDVWGE